MTIFCKGDKVRVKDPDWELHCDVGNDIAVYTDLDVGVVKDKSSFGDGFIEICYDGLICTDMTEDELVLVEKYDAKQEFLSHLRSLLQEFDAEIVASIGEDDTTYQDKPLMYIQIGNEVCNYERGIEYCDITADNIMEYDKN